MTTQELTKEVLDMKSKLSGLEEKMEDSCARLKTMEVEVKEQGKLLNTIDKLVMGLARLDEKITDLTGKIDDFGGRIKLIELKPAEKWERIAYKILEYFVLGGLGFLAAKLIGGV